MFSSEERFEQSIQLFDPLLSLRKSSFLYGKWIIERKAHIPETEMEFLKRRRDRLRRFVNAESAPHKRARLNTIYSQVAEEFASAQAGRRVVLFADQLDRRIFDALVTSDIQRYGGYSRYADELEAAEKRREQQAERELARMRDDLHAEAHDKMNFAWAHKDSKLLHWDGKTPLSTLIK